MSALTVGDLKKIIENMDDNYIVVLQKDSEGNNYSPCAGWEASPGVVYIPENNYSGEVYSMDTEEEEDEEEKMDNVNCLLLFPIN